MRLFPTTPMGAELDPNSLQSHTSKFTGTMVNVLDSFMPWSTRSREMRVQIMQKCWESLKIFSENSVICLFPWRQGQTLSRSLPSSKFSSRRCLPSCSWRAYTPICLSKSQLELFKRFQILPHYALPFDSALVSGLFHPLVLPRAKHLHARKLK